MFTKRSTSGFFMVMAVFNLIVAIIPPIAATVGVFGMMRDSDIVINGKQVGPEFDKEVAKAAPLAKIESFAALGVNSFSCLLMLAGSVGLFMGYGIGRWATVAGAVLMVFGLLVHDVYQIFFYRPALMAAFDRIAEPFLAVFGNLPGQQDNHARTMLQGSIAALRWGTVVYTCAWSCTNPLIMLYLFVMTMCMAFMTGFYDTGGIDKDGAKPALRGEDDDEDEDEEDEEEEEDRRPAKKKKRKDRGEYEED